jgi:hypothetical protein
MLRIAGHVISLAWAARRHCATCVAGGFAAAWIDHPAVL